MKTYTAYFNRFSLTLPKNVVTDCAHQGACDEDVKHWAGGYPDRLPQLHALDTEKLRDELRGYGTWDGEDLADDQANRERILWLASCDILDEHRKDFRR